MKTHQLFKLATVVFVLTLLQGCHLFSKQQAYQLPTNAAEIKQFTARGKLLLADKKEKVSGYFYWQNNTGRLEINLNTFVGINMFKLVYQDGFATLTSNGEEYTDADPEALILRLTGKHIPVQKLSSWMLGQSTSDLENVSFDEQSRLKQFDVVIDGATWTGKYKSWQQVHNFDLPKELNLRSPNNRIKLSISEWQVGS